MVAMEEPEMAAKKVQAAMAAMTLPPLIRPKIIRITWVRYLEVLPREAKIGRAHV